MNDVGRSSPVDMSARAGMSDDQVLIRDLAMGSHLGLLQTRYVNTLPGPFGSGTVVDGMASASSNNMFGREIMPGNGTVSYTHLTLPTKA